MTFEDVFRQMKELLSGVEVAQRTERLAFQFQIEGEGEGNFYVELKVWRGKKYNEAGESQLIDYLNLYHLDEGYMLTFSFNKNKHVGTKEGVIQGKRILEAIV